MLSTFACVAGWTGHHQIIRAVAATKDKRYHVVHMVVVTHQGVAVVAAALLAIVLGLDVNSGVCAAIAHDPGEAVAGSRVTLLGVCGLVGSPLCSNAFFIICMIGSHPCSNVFLVLRIVHGRTCSNIFFVLCTIGGCACSNIFFVLRTIGSRTCSNIFFVLRMIGSRALAHTPFTLCPKSVSIPMEILPSLRQLALALIAGLECGIIEGHRM